LRPAAARRADVVLRDAVVREVLRARVPVVRRVPVVPARVLVLRPIGLRGLRAAARPPARAAAVRRARVVVVRPVVLRRAVVRPVVERAVVVRRVPVVRRAPVVRRVPVVRAAVARPPARPAARLCVVRAAVVRPPLRPAAARRVDVVLRDAVLRARVPVERRVPPVRFLVPSSSTPSASSNICLLLLRDLLDDVACLCVFALTGDIGLGQDSNQLSVFLRDGQPADLVLRHQAQRFIQVLLRIDGHQIA
jgi:hypothetical protein